MWTKNSVKTNVEQLEFGSFRPKIKIAVVLVTLPTLFFSAQKNNEIILFAKILKLLCSFIASYQILCF
jgi:hypothetical protein